MPGGHEKPQHRFTRAELHDDLAFGAGSESDEKAKIAILVGSLFAGLVATIILRIRNRVHRRICAEESVDSDHDGIPDVHQHEGETRG